MKALLDVGGGSKTRAMPPYFEGWRHDCLDVDATVNPDILMDARELQKLPAATYDAVFCSHNLEHYHRHEVRQVVRGFLQVLKPDGFAEIRVPDILWVMWVVVENNMDIDDELYVSNSGPILVRDVLYGFHKEIERSGKDYFAHRTGFSPKSLALLLRSCGFFSIAIGSQIDYEITAFAFKKDPTAEQIQMVLRTIKKPSQPFLKFPNQ